MGTLGWNRHFLAQGFPAFKRPSRVERYSQYKGAEQPILRRETEQILGVARMTGLEPATSGVTGRRSNQLSYIRLKSKRSPISEGRLICLLTRSVNRLTGHHRRVLSKTPVLCCQRVIITAITNRTPGCRLAWSSTLPVATLNRLRIARRCCAPKPTKRLASGGQTAA